MSKKIERRRRRRARAIHAGGSAGVIALAADVSIEAAPAEGQKPTFRVAAYNGGAMRIKGYPLPVVVDLAGLESASSVTANMDHDQTQRVGHVTAMQNDGKTLVLEGVVSGVSDAAREVVEAGKNGYPWQASIEAMPIADVEEIPAGKSVSVNGQTFRGPILVARRTKLYGFAFLARGADETTTVQIAASAEIPPKENKMDKDLRAYIEAAGFDPDEITESQVKFFAKQREQEIKANGTPKVKTFDQLMAEEKERRDRYQKITAMSETLLHSDELRGVPGVLEKIDAMTRQAFEEDWSVERYEIESMRNIRPMAHPVYGQINNGPQITNEVIEAAISQAIGLRGIEKEYKEPVLEAAHKHFPRGIGLQQAMLLAARSNGFNTGMSQQVTLDVQRAAFRQQGPMEIRAAGFTTIDLSGILSNVANKAVRRAFESVDQTCMSISAISSLRDFKQRSTYSLTGDFQYTKIGPGGELKHDSFGEETYTNQLETYGRLIAISRQDIINDDLGALQSRAVRLGRGAMLALNDVFWTVFLNNSTFFAAGNSNVSTGAGSALASAGLTAAEVVFMNQTDPDGKPLGLMPSLLLVPPTLKQTALALMNSALIVTGADTTLPDGNVWRGRFDVYSSPYMENSSYTGYSAAAWYLLANPMDMPVVEIGFLNGQQSPTIETADADFNTLGIQLRGYHDFGVAMQEPRGGVRSAGS